MHLQHHLPKVFGFNHRWNLVPEIPYWLNNVQVEFSLFLNKISYIYTVPRNFNNNIFFYMNSIIIYGIFWDNLPSSIKIFRIPKNIIRIITNSRSRDSLRDLFKRWEYYLYVHNTYRCPRRNVPNFGRVFLMLNYTDITQNTYIQSWTVTEIMAREAWNFDSCYTLTDYQIDIKTGMNMWFL